MRILITGANGQLGQELFALLHSEAALPITPTDVAAAGKGELDVTRKEEVFHFIQKYKPDVIFHCAAATDVDGCEASPKRAYLVNRDGCAFLACAAQSIKAKLVVFSTDYVFSGENTTPYREEEACRPLMVYGASKREGEVAALQHCSRSFVVRTAWLYSRYQNNFVKSILNRAKAGRPFSVVGDQIGSPTWAKALAYNSLCLASTEQYGLYHCAGRGACSRYDFAKEILRLGGLSCPLSPSKSPRSALCAPRPAYAALCSDKISRIPFVKMESWQEQLRQFFAEYRYMEEKNEPVFI